MRSSSSRSRSPERAPVRKNKSQSQREYRYKEMDGFFELRNALLLADPFNSPLGRDATRPQLLIAAAKKLRNLSDENQKLTLQLSAMPSIGLYQRDIRAPPEMTACSYFVSNHHASQPYNGQHSGNPAAADVALETQDIRLLMAGSELVTPGDDLQSSIPSWPQELHPFHTHHGHQLYDTTLGPPYQPPRVMDVQRFH